MNPSLKSPPLWKLLAPRKQTKWFLTASALGAALGAFGMWIYNWPLWVASALFLALLIFPGLAKWRADRQRYGRVAMGLSFLIFSQGFHSIEHLVQWFQFHVLNLTARNSSGLLSPANNEWVHFTWNTLVLVVIVLLVILGLRNGWAWALLAWAFMHTAEHTYMFIRFLEMRARLKEMGIDFITAQGLPGILGEGGWLALSDLTRGTFWSKIPFLTTATRLDIHFWWNAGEIILLVLAANVFISQLLRDDISDPASTGGTSLPIGQHSQV